MLTLAVYGRAVGFGFLAFDDPTYVTENFHVLRGLTLAGLRWALTKVHDSNWVPLTWLSLMLDATIYGPRAGGFHATNILLHVLNVLLVFALLTQATGCVLRARLCRGALCCPSAARRIGGLDCRAEGRAEHVLRLALAVVLRAVGEAAATGLARAGARRALS